MYPKSLCLKSYCLYYLKPIKKFCKILTELWTYFYIIITSVIMYYVIKWNLKRGSRSEKCIKVGPSLFYDISRLFYKLRYWTPSAIESACNSTVIHSQEIWAWLTWAAGNSTQYFSSRPLLVLVYIGTESTRPVSLLKRTECTRRGNHRGNINI